MAARRCSVIELDVKARDLCLFLSGFVTERQTVEENEWTLDRNSVRVDRELSPVCVTHWYHIDTVRANQCIQCEVSATRHSNTNISAWIVLPRWTFLDIVINLRERGNKLKISSSLSCIMIEIICCYHYGFVNWTKWNIVVCCGNPSRYFEKFKLIFSQWKLLCRRIWW